MGRRHWIDELADKIASELEKRGKKDFYVFNGGLSVSGLQHIGRLRGEIILGEAIRRILEQRGYRIKQLLTLYTQDAWKGKKGQIEAFPGGGGDRYKGWPLIKVPDPYGCHANWVEHFWSDFGPYISEFTDGNIEIVDTTTMYKTIFKPFVRETIQKRSLVREIVNKYRGRNPYPENWIPFEPICERCGRIDKTKTLSYDPKTDTVEYVCRACGYKGTRSIEKGKLNWRIEWTGVWKVLGVDFEPYGKDHAAPGGSRDSCKELAEKAYNFHSPLGEWYEWVSIRIRRGQVSDMSSSGFVGITPKQWLEVAHPHILRFLYLSTHPHRKIVVDISRIPQYYEEYYRAERVYFGLEDAGEDTEYLKRTYELSHPDSPPEKPPSQPPYTHVALLAQNLPSKRKFEIAVERLKRTGHIGELDDYSKAWLAGLLEKTVRWVELYMPQLKYKVPEEPPEQAYSQIQDPERLYRLADALEEIPSWDEQTIKQTLIEFGRDLDSQERKTLYRDFYLALLGKPSGPRAAPLLAVLEKDFVVKRLKRPSTQTG